MKDYRLETKIKNNRLLARVEEAGYASIAAFARACNINHREVGKLINLKSRAKKKDGSYRLAVLKMAEVLCCDPSELFTEIQAEGFEKTLFLHEIGEHDAMALSYTATETVEEIVWEHEREEIVRVRLRKVLTPREAEIVDQRYGLSSGEEKTLEEVACINNVTRERIRQIEARAFRKIRKTDAGILRGLIGS